MRRYTQDKKSNKGETPAQSKRKIAEAPKKITGETAPRKGKKETLYEVGTKTSAPKGAKYFIGINMIKPMLAREYQGVMTLPLVIQPKYDGVRAVFDGEKLYTRNGKEILGVDHIIEQCKDLELFPLDGELVLAGTEGQSEFFNEASGVVRSHATNKPLTYIIYDVIIPKLTFGKRYMKLDSLGIEHYQHLKLATTYMCMDYEYMNTIYDRMIVSGFEGIMLRHVDGLYEQGKRSYGLQKLKPFETSEYTIVEAIEGEGKLRGKLGALRVQGDGVEFTVKMAVTDKELLELFGQKCHLINKQLTVKYQGKSAAGVPRFPIGLTIRDYE